MHEAWLALAGTLFGGAGFKIIEHFLGRTKRKEDSATTFRAELRAEVTELRTEADKLRDETDELRKEIDIWRRKYYSLVSSIAKGDLESAQRKITD
jgi:uncharacterized coiled-coil DUF342 family protein